MKKVSMYVLCILLDKKWKKTFRLFTLGMNEKHGRMTNITTTIPVVHSFSWNIWSYVESIHYKLSCEIPHWCPDGFQNPRTFEKWPNGSCRSLMSIRDYLCLSFPNNLLKTFYSMYCIIFKRYESFNTQFLLFYCFTQFFQFLQDISRL